MANQTVAVPGLVLIIILVQYVCIAQKMQPLRISDDKRNIVYEDGTPFLWLGDTAWELIPRHDREEVNSYLSDRASKGFTMIQTVIWQMYSMDRSPVLNARTGWKEALHLPGPRHMGFLKDLFTALPWQKMQFRQDLIAGENPEDSGYIVCAMGQDKDFLLAYTPEGRAIALDLSPLNTQTVRAYRYNPRSGCTVYIDELNTGESRLFEPWASGRGSDFVLILLDPDASIGLPRGPND